MCKLQRPQNLYCIVDAFSPCYKTVFFYIVLEGHPVDILHDYILKVALIAHIKNLDDIRMR